MASKNKEVEFLKLLYQEVIDGVSPIENYFVRHLTDLDEIEILRRRINLCEKYIKDGVPSVTQRLKELHDSQEWTKEDEDEILSLRYQILDNEKTIGNVIAEQRDMIRRVINDKQKKLQEMVVKRAEYLGSTAEEFAEQEAESYKVFISFFKDRECKVHLFETLEDFEAIDESELIRLSKLCDNATSKITDKNIRKMSVLNFFINVFSYAKDSIHTFLNKPISQLTGYQLHLFSMGTRNLNILRQATNPPPELLDDVKVEDVLIWYDKNYQLLISKRNES